MTLPSQPVMLLLPDGYTGAAVPLVMYHHGSSENFTAPRRDALKRALISHLLANGYAVVSISAHGNNWGSPIAQQDYINLWAWVQNQISVSRLLFLGQSMGGMTSATVAARGVMPVRGVAGIYPAYNLQDMYDKGFGATIRTAYGMAGDGSDYATKSSGHDPVLRAGGDFTGLRMRFYASPDDTVVGKVANSDAMAAVVAEYATESDVVVCSGQHGHTSHFQSADLLSFFDRCV